MRRSVGETSAEDRYRWKRSFSESTSRRTGMRDFLAFMFGLSMGILLIATLAYSDNAAKVKGCMLENRSDSCELKMIPMWKIYRDE